MAEPGKYLNSKRQRLELLRSQLEQDRSSFMDHWRDLGSFILPRRPRFLVTDVNRGDRRNQSIIDSTATMAARTLQSGMMAGMSSPSRPWFSLTTDDADLAEFGPVKDWLESVKQRMFSILVKSNFYKVLSSTYGDTGVFATACQFIEEDFTGKVIRSKSFPIGSYSIGVDEHGRVNTFFREFQFSVRQMIDAFGRKGTNGQPDWSNFSSHVKNLWDKGETQTKVTVCHVLYPNSDYNPNSIYSKYNKRFASCYYEKGSQEGSQSNYFSASGTNDNVYLRESGYNLFPALVPRWSVTGEDAWGTDCPGMTCLGDVKQLQKGERRSMQAIDKLVNPPMNAPGSMRNSKASILSGDINYVDSREGMQGFRPVWEINPRIQELEAKQSQCRSRIQRAFYEDMFLLLSTSETDPEKTAREINELHEEKLFALGPMLENMNDDLFGPAIDLTFDIMLRQGLIPPAPPEIEGMDLKVVYISVMAQAQKMMGVASIERFLGTVTQAAAVDASVLDKVDIDETIDQYGSGLGVPAGIIRTDEKVAEIRSQRAEQQRQDAAVAAAESASKTAKNLAQADTSGDNALTKLLKTSGTRRAA